MGKQKAFKEIADTSFTSECDLLVGDAFKKLKNYNDGKFDLTITSPPYNLGKEYETRKTIQQYLENQKKIIDEIIRVTSEKGSICWQVGNFVKDGEIFPLDTYYYNLFKDAGLKLRNRIIWHFGHGLHASNRFSGRYETILWFSKTDDYIFNLDPVRVPAKYPGKRHYKGPNKGKLSGNPKGKNPSDIWQVLIRDWEKELWNIPNCKANHTEKTEHPCQYPVELVERCILALSDEDSWVLDPFAGVGSTAIAALKNNRRSVGIDKEEKYINIAKERITALKNGNLKLRPITKQIHKPTGKERTAKVPESFSYNKRGGK